MDSPPEIPEFHDVRRRDDGMWVATHFGSGKEITAPTFDLLARIEAPMARILHWYRRSGLSA